MTTENSPTSLSAPGRGCSVNGASPLLNDIMLMMMQRPLGSLSILYWPRPLYTAKSINYYWVNWLNQHFWTYNLQTTALLLWWWGAVNPSGGIRKRNRVENWNISLPDWSPTRTEDAPFISLIATWTQTVRWHSHQHVRRCVIYVLAVM